MAGVMKRVRDRFGTRLAGVRGQHEFSMNCAEGTRRAASRQFILRPFSRLPAETITHPDETG
jgi:hypothetical protein